MTVETSTRESTNPPPRRGGTRARTVATGLGWVLALLALAGAAAHFFPGGSSRTVAVGAFSSQLLTLAPVSVILLASARRRLGTILASAVLIGAVVLVGPTYVGSPGDARGTALTVLTANVKLGEAGADGVVKAARNADADVVLLQELTPALRERLAAAGLDRRFRYSLVEALPGADGVGLWSRFPLTGEQRHEELTFAAVSARVDLGEGKPAPTVLTVHAAGPWPQSAHDWVRDIAKLPALLREVSADADRHGSTVLVGGDFNATWGNSQFRNLLQGGYRDAAEQLGRPWTATFPSGSVVPPLIGIDHLLLRASGAESLDTVEIPGSDHRGVVVRVTVDG